MAAFSTALYYPWMDIRDEGWIKNALLYWDTIQTIVPESVKQPYESQTARELQDEGLLQPFFVESGMVEIESLTADVLTYMESRREAISSLRRNQISATFIPKSCQMKLGDWYVFTHKKCHTSCVI